MHRDLAADFQLPEEISTFHLAQRRWLCLKSRYLPSEWGQLFAPSGRRASVCRVRRSPLYYAAALLSAQNLICVRGACFIVFSILCGLYCALFANSAAPCFAWHRIEYFRPALPAAHNGWKVSAMETHALREKENARPKECAAPSKMLVASAFHGLFRLFE